MKYSFLFIILLILSSCQNSQQQTETEDNSEIVAMVGEKPVSAGLLRAYLKANGITKTDAASLNTALDGLINEVAMAELAKKDGVQLTREQSQGLKYLELRAFSSAAQKNYLDQIQVTDEEIADAYDKGNKQIGGFEYHIHHLLYKDEVEALKHRDEIKSVEDFQALEKQYLKDNPGQRNMGDLSWVTLGQLPEAFRKAIPSAEVNTVLKDTVKSPYGAHIVYYQEKREITPPKLEDVKQGIINTIKKQKLSKFSQLARAKTKVVIKE